MPDFIRIANTELSAEINPLGAELWSLKDADGRELMTDADPAFWAGHAPILFPVVGRPSGEVIRIDGVAYPMKQHGFARHSLFEVVAADAGSATFALTDNEATRAAYPFAFRLEITFRLDGATLHTDVTITNPANTPLPASFGFHPAFAWPLPYGQPRADHRIAFGSDEPDALRAIAPDGTIAVESTPSPLEGRVLPLTDELFAHDALVWDNVRSDRVRYGAPSGPALEINFPDTPMLGIWTRPGAHYICVEPWHGIADPEGFAGKFRDKPGVFKIAAKGEKRITMSVTLVP